MDKKPRICGSERQKNKILAFIAGLAAVVAGLCLVSIDDGAGDREQRSIPASMRMDPIVVSPPPDSMHGAVSEAASSNDEALLDESDSLRPPVLELQSGSLAWEAQLDTLLASQLPERDKAIQLLRRLGALPPEAYSRVVQEAVDRLPDQDYASVALPILLNPATHGAAESILFADLLERPDAITLPALLSLARMSNHPFSQSARESLAQLINGDFGTNWVRWEAEVSRALTDQ